MNEEIYRLMHYLAVLTWVGGNAILFFGGTYQETPPKEAKITVGIASFLDSGGGHGTDCPRPRT